ncbi:hypothetical protein N5U55_10670 [Aliarcobacter butzleri]|uniref:hypothetical protein n=1 Tax=Aliarcobacter butzleri TaxID=28197 RepID=UPI0021B22D3E|nr:hypothetical protein [Aliarcobacter butzleri]MCT7584572.1 hypothetical protein [Aliarcobacter butzleri]
MIDFLLTDAFDTLFLIMWSIAFIFLIVWIKTKKKNHFIFFISSMLIIIAFSTYCIFFYTNYYENKTKEYFLKIVPKEVVVKTLTEIIQSEENKNFSEFRHFVDYYMKKDFLTEDDLLDIIEANKNIDFKRSIQFTEQEWKDFEMLLKLTEDIK